MHWHHIRIDLLLLPVIKKHLIINFDPNKGQHPQVSSPNMVCGPFINVDPSTNLVWVIAIGHRCHVTTHDCYSWPKNYLGITIKNLTKNFIWYTSYLPFWVLTMVLKSWLDPNVFMFLDNIFLNNVQHKNSYCIAILKDYEWEMQDALCSHVTFYSSEHQRESIN